MDAPIFTKRFRRVFLANAFSDLSANLFIHFPGLLRDLGAGEALIGAIASVAVLVSVVFRPGVGQAMDRRGRLPIVRVAAVVRVVATVSFLTIGGIGPWVFVVRAVHGLSTAVVFTGLFTYANDLMPPERRTQAIALFGLSGMIPGMFGPATGDVILHRFGYSGLFVTMALLDVVALMVIRTMKPLVKTGSFAQRLGFRKVVAVPGLRSVWVMTLSFGLVFSGLQTFMRTFVDTNRVGTVGLFFFAYSATAATLRLFMSWAPDRLGYKRVMYPVILCQAVGLFLLSGVSTVPRFVVGAMLTGAGHAFLFPVLARLAVERSPAEDRGSATGIFTAMFDLALLVGAPTLGLLVESRGYAAMYATLGAIVLVAASVFAWMERVKAPAAV